MLERNFSSYLSSLSRQRPTPKALAEARVHLIDALACYYGAQSLPSIRRLETAFSDSSSGPCSRWNGAASVSPERAVLLNGAGVRALDYNDTYLSREPCHP